MRMVLVHGGMHGAWCWERVIPALAEQNIDAVAPDLPGHGQRTAEPATLTSYRDAVLEVIEPGDILVGHSLGGVVVTVAADAAHEQIAGVVYLAALIPAEGLPMAAIAPDLTKFGEVSATHLTVTDPLKANTVLFNDCAPEDQQWAFQRLCPQSLEPVFAPVSAPRMWNGSIPRAYITCLADRTGLLDLTAGYLDRLGLDQTYIMPTSHSPFISCPNDVANTLLKAAEGLRTPC
jgi:pimeloyl-ACP methyl ester carboxylesterase